MTSVRPKTQLIAELDNACAHISELESTAITLQAAERQNQFQIEAISDMILTLNSDGTYLDFIPSKECAPHVSPEEFIGSQPSRLWRARGKALHSEGAGVNPRRSGKANHFRRDITGMTTSYRD